MGDEPLSATDDFLEPTTAQRRACVVEILADGLMRLKKRGALRRDDSTADETTSETSLDLGKSPLELSQVPGLTVHDG